MYNDPHPRWPIYDQNYLSAAWLAHKKGDITKSGQSNFEKDGHLVICVQSRSTVFMHDSHFFPVLPFQSLTFQPSLKSDEENGNPTTKLTEQGTLLQ